MKNTGQGFTLIELLIVIAIIGILAAVLIPNLLSARNKANDSGTQAFMRSVITGMETLRDSVSGALPTTAPDCFTAAGKAALPASVKSCTITYTGAANADAYTIAAESVNGSKFAYDGKEIKSVP